MRIGDTQRISNLNCQVQQFVSFQRLSGNAVLDSLALQVLHDKNGVANHYASSLRLDQFLERAIAVQRLEVHRVP
jgi:hypothetical protein